MKALPTNVGAEPKKLALLGAIVVLGLILVYWANSGTDGPPQAAGTSPAATVSANVPASQTAPRPSSGGSSGASSGPRLQTRGGSGRTVEDFRPTLKPQEGVDISRVDPRLRTELLARLRALPEQGSNRSVFEFYTPPVPPPKVEPIKPAQVTVAPPPPPKPVVTGPPPTPPIPLKYYGFAGPAGNRTQKGLFLDADEMIFVASENEMIRNRYRVIRIGARDVEIEDTVTKSKETIRITPENDV